MEAENAFDEVNETRAKKGLKPFKYDVKLTEGAMACAVERATKQIKGHLRDDFAFLPEGTKASGAGCAAWPPDMGWGACFTYEDYEYGGAAYAIGEDGLRYMHLFVL